MAINEPLLEEFKQESALTRKMLERVPLEHPEWKPHEKSMTIQRLASHIADLPLWMERIIDHDGFDVDSLLAQRFLARDIEELLQRFQDTSSIAIDILQRAADDIFSEEWTMKKGGKQIYTRKKSGLIRSLVFSHSIHHRGQLSVYLRLSNIPVPGVYGPSADER